MAGASALGYVLQVVILDRRMFDRLALQVLCLDQPQLAVAASVDDVAAAVAVVARSDGTIVLVGRQVVRTAGDGVITRLRRAGAERVLLVGTGDPERLRLEAMRMDADGILQRDGEPAAQARALRGDSGAVPRWVDQDGFGRGRSTG
jgi:DNA-binding NarL/FixJ family response regulator